MSESKAPVAIMAVLMMAMGISLSLCLAAVAIQDHPVTPVAVTVTPTKPAPMDASALLISVNDVTVMRPTLEWLAVIKYSHEINQYYVVMISPATQSIPASTATPAKTIASYYSDEIRKQQRALVIQAALGRISPGLGDTFVDISFDRRAIAETIALLGPFECQGRIQTGDELMLQVDAIAPEAAEERLQLQGQLLACLFNAAKKQGWDFPTLMDRLGRSFYPSRDHAAAVFVAAPPLAQSQINLTQISLNPAEPTPQP